jgi:hypothetical protein
MSCEHGEQAIFPWKYPERWEVSLPVPENVKPPYVAVNIGGENEHVGDSNQLMTSRSCGHNRCGAKEIS